MRALPTRLVEAGFHLLYHDAAWIYDAVAAAVSLGQWRSWGAAALPFLPGPRVLELGHGPGHILVALAAAGYDATGIDLSPQMGRLAARRLANLSGRPALIRARAQELPVPSGALDGILATFPTRYIIDPRTLAEVHRALRPGGALVVVPEARLGGQRAHVRFIRWLYEATGQSGYPDGSAARDFWSASLAPAGFDISAYPIHVGDSVATVIVARRPLESPGSR